MIYKSHFSPNLIFIRNISDFITRLEKQNPILMPFYLLKFFRVLQISNIWSCYNSGFLRRPSCFVKFFVIFYKKNLNIIMLQNLLIFGIKTRQKIKQPEFDHLVCIGVFLCLCVAFFQLGIVVMSLTGPNQQLSRFTTFFQFQRGRAHYLDRQK